MDNIIRELVYQAINQTLLTFGKSINIDDDTALKGNNSIFDSLEFVAFISELDPLITNELRQDIELLDQISKNNGKIFESIKNLIEYIENQ